MPKKPLPKPLALFLTGLKIIGKTLLLLPLVAAMVWANFTIDMSGMFHGEQFEKDIALAMETGQAVDNYDRMNERGVLRQIAQSIETPYDVLAFGSSRVLQLREGMVGGGRFLNCGVSAADFVDILSLYYEFDRAGMQPGTVILQLDPWILSRYSYDRQQKSDKNLFAEFLNLRLGYDLPFTAATDDTAEKVKALLSPSYLQGNLQAYLKGGDNYTPPAIVQGDLTNHKSNVKLSDGSVLYIPSFRNASPEEVLEQTRNHAVNFMWMDEFYELDPELCGIFDSFVQYLKGQGIKVVFLLSPYHPLVYTNATEYPEKYAGFFQTEPYFVQYALQNDIPVYGSYNPFVAGTLEDAFYDGLHIKEEALARVLPSLPEIETEWQAGQARSPWLRGRVRVEQPVAEILVNQRYEIPPEQELVRLADETHNGIPCYVFGRYTRQSEAERAGLEEKGAERLLLARYAVTQDEGIIYRFDTDLNTWVVDRRGLMG